MIKLSTQFGDQTQRLNNYASGGGGCCCCCSCVVTLVGFTIVTPIVLSNAMKASPPKTLTIEQDEVEVYPLYDQNNDQRSIEQSETNQPYSVPMTDTSNIHTVKNTAWIITNILVAPLLLGFFILATMAMNEFNIISSNSQEQVIVISLIGLLCVTAYIVYFGFVYKAHGKNGAVGSLIGLGVLLISVAIFVVEFFTWLRLITL